MKTTKVASLKVNGQEVALEIQEWDNGKRFTAIGPGTCSDYCKRGSALRYLKRCFANPGVEITWFE